MLAMTWKRRGLERTSRGGAYYSGPRARAGHPTAPGGSRSTRSSSRSRRASRGSPVSCAKSSRRATSATSGPFSAFTIAFQVPNLLRALVADSALSAAFVPVFTELLEQKKRKDAFQLAGALFGLILVVLGAITVLFIVIAPWVIPPITGDKFSAELDQLTVGLSRVMFPIVVLLGLNGLVVGILNAYDHFAIPAIAPLVWNFVIIATLVLLKPLFEGPNEVYAYALGVLAGTVVQFGMCLPVLRRVGFELKISFNFARPAHPAGAAADAAGHDRPRPHQLQPADQLDPRLAGERRGRRRRSTARSGSTCCRRASSRSRSRPCCSRRCRRLAARHDLDGLRRASGNGVRHDRAVPDPGRRRDRGARRAAHAPRLPARGVRRRRRPTTWPRRCSGSRSRMPFSGANLLLTRTFFSLQRPWVPTALAGVTLLINVGGLGRALQAARDRGRGDRHRGGERRDDGRAGLAPAARAARLRDRPHAARRGADAGRLGGARRDRLLRLGGARFGARRRR